MPNATGLQKEQNVAIARQHLTPTIFNSLHRKCSLRLLTGRPVPILPVDLLANSPLGQLAIHSVKKMKNRPWPTLARSLAQSDCSWPVSGVHASLGPIRQMLVQFGRLWSSSGVCTSFLAQLRRLWLCKPVLAQRPPPGPRWTVPPLAGPPPNLNPITTHNNHHHHQQQQQQPPPPPPQPTPHTHTHTHTHTHHQHHHHQSHVSFKVGRVLTRFRAPAASQMVAGRDGGGTGAARRRRERQLRAWQRHGPPPQHTAPTACGGGAERGRGARAARRVTATEASTPGDAAGASGGGGRAASGRGSKGLQGGLQGWCAVAGALRAQRAPPGPPSPPT